MSSSASARFVIDGSGESGIAGPGAGAVSVSRSSSTTGAAPSAAKRIREIECPQTLAT